MKKILTIAILTILTSTVAFANDDKQPAKETKEESSKVVNTKETMKLIKKKREKNEQDVQRKKPLVLMIKTLQH